jgi:DNA-directed RNA polymerase specialized sigma24 family protein
MNFQTPPFAPPPPASEPALDPEAPPMTLDAKKRFLTSRPIETAIRRKARSRGVPSQDVPDVVQQTLAFAWKARLPADAEGATRVVNRIAFRVACTLMRRPVRANETHPYDEVEDESEAVAQAADPAYDAALREQVQELLDRGQRRFPERFGAFLASVFDEVPAEAEAQQQQVRVERVRKERREIRAFMERHGQKMGLVLVAALVLLVFGSMGEWTRGRWDVGPDDRSAWTSPRRRRTEPAADAGSLRVLAAKRYRDGEYEAFLRDLDAAKAMDHRDDTPEEAQMRANAMRALRADDAPELPSK